MLHASVRKRLDPNFIKFYEKYIINVFPPPEIWDPSARYQKSPFSSADLPVVRSFWKDIEIKQGLLARVYFPKKRQPERPRPVVLWFHGGGFVFGDRQSEKSLLTRVSRYASCVVVSVEYKLAPEHPFPNASRDVNDALRWVHKSGSEDLGIDPEKIIVAGISAGANLAAVVALEAAELDPPIPLVLQILVVPVINNSTDSLERRKENWHAPGLDIQKISWYQRKYIKKTGDGERWQASPHLAPEYLLSKAPKAFILIAEVDVVRSDGVEYGEILKNVGVEVELKEYRGAPHMVMGMGGVMRSGKLLMFDVISAISESFAPRSRSWYQNVAPRLRIVRLRASLGLIAV